MLEITAAGRLEEGREGEGGEGGERPLTVWDLRISPEEQGLWVP